MWKKNEDMAEKRNEKFMEKVDKIINFLGGRKFLIMWLIIFYVLMGYNYQIRSWYNDNIIPTLDRFEPNTWIFWITFLPIFFVVYNLLKRSLVRYQSDKKEISTLLFISIILIICRCSGDYDYVPFTENVSYVDLIWVICVTYLTVAIINKCRLYYTNWKNKNKIKPNSLLNDWPIESASQDRFGLKNDVDKIVYIIKELNNSKTWSLAINGSWGAGKTSFINLIKEKIEEKNDYEVIKFNPRTSKSASHIQEDFFNTLASALSKYDSSFSYNLKAYMESLQLIDESGIVKKVVDFYHIWNKKSIKKNIEDSFDSLEKRVLVMIDDFDRLTREEILEVLKLIDSNAAFPKLVFITAYDKEQVNNILKELNKSDDACFIDKFFNLEYSLPMHISSYLMNTIYRDLRWDDNDKNEILDAISKYNSIFDKYIDTPRDAKRYINLFMVDYEQVAGEVITEEFLLVQLIKYRDSGLFNKIYQGQFTEPNSTNFDLISLKNGLDTKLKMLPILNELFDKKPAHAAQSYRHIYSKSSFDSYFTNQINYPLRMKDMNNLFSQEWKDVTKAIDEWSADNAKIDDFLDYLDCIYFERNENNILTYTKILAYIACKMPYSRAYKLFMQSICISESNNSKFKQELLDNITNTVRDLILNKEYDTRLDLAQNMHLDYVLGVYDQEDYLLSDVDIWPIVKDTFISSLGSSKDEEYIFNNLCRCAESMEPNSRKINLDKDCAAAYREHIETYPNWYIQNFVGMGMESSSPDWNTVACRIFWHQIFGGERQLKEYLKQCKDKNIEKADLAWNFWRLFEANGYKQIEFENQGNIQDKIDNNLVEECKLLDKLLEIQKEVNNISKNLVNNKEKWDSNVKKSFIEILNKNMNDLNNVKLYIKLNGDIRKDIERNLIILKEK